MPNPTMSKQAIPSGNGILQQNIHRH